MSAGLVFRKAHRPVVVVAKNAAWKASLNAAGALEPRIVRAIAQWLAALTGVTIRQLEAAINAGDVGMIVASIWDEAAENEGIDDIDARLESTLAGVVADMVAKAGLSQWGSLGITADFALDNPYSIAWIPEYAAEQVTLVSDATKKAIAEVVERGFVEGNPPREMAQEIKEMIGLLDSQERTLSNYTTALRAAKRPNGKPLYTDEQIRRMSAKKHAQLLTERAEMVARTETIDAHANGALQSWQVARDEGYLPAGVRKIWSAALASERTCPICRALHGSIVELDGEFEAKYKPSPKAESKTITRRAPTAHPRCRCAMKLEIT